MTVLGAGAFMAQLDFVIVNVALNGIGKPFAGSPESLVSWVLSAYAVVFAAVLVPVRRLADRYGHKKVLLGGVPEPAVRNLRLVCHDDELASVLGQFGLSPWLASLPDGLESILGERGTTGSGGERQRPGVARVLLAGRPVMVLDEPTVGVSRYRPRTPTRGHALRAWADSCVTRPAPTRLAGNGV